METVLALLPIRIPAGRLDGAIVELHQDEDGTMAADIRIPGPAAP